MKPILREKIYKNNGKINVKELFYKNGKIKRTEYPLTDEFVEYNEHGDTVSIYSKNSNVINKCENTYNDDGSKTLKFINVDDGVDTHDRIYKFDSHNNIIFIQEGDNKTINEIKYNEYGNILEIFSTEEIETTDDGIKIIKSKTKYEYNDKNDVITITDNDNKLEFIYDYDRLISACRGINYNNEEIVSVKKYKDIIGGELLEYNKTKTCHDNSGAISVLNKSHTKWEYDKLDRVCKTIYNNCCVTHPKNNKSDVQISSVETLYEYYKDTDILLKEISSNGDVVEYIYDNLDI